MAENKTTSLENIPKHNLPVGTPAQINSSESFAGPNGSPDENPLIRGRIGPIQRGAPLPPDGHHRRLVLAQAKLDEFSGVDELPFVLGETAAATDELFD